MKLTKKRAIELSIELWEWMAETGAEYKDAWLGWAKYGKMDNYCPLCEYVGLAGRWKGHCKKCPLGWGYYGCQWAEQSQYPDWEDANTEKGRKEYAKLFLEQLKQLK